MPVHEIRVYTVQTTHLRASVGNRLEKQPAREPSLLDGAVP